MDVGMIQHSHLELELVILGRTCTDVHRTYHHQQQQQQRNYPESRPPPSSSPVDLRFLNPLFTSLRVQHDPSHANRRSDRVAGTRANEQHLPPAPPFAQLPAFFPSSRPVPSRSGDGMPCRHILYTPSPLGGRVSCAVEAHGGREAGWAAGRDGGACRPGLWLWLWLWFGGTGCMYVPS
jgi:hypothetical protein